MRIILILFLLLCSSCETVPVKSDCGVARCMPEEHSPLYWRQP
jgi:hypothetical protein